jgi:hypothetical protein
VATYKTQRKKEKREIAYSILADIGVGAATVFTGGAAGYAVGAAGVATDATIIYGTLAGAAVGGVSTVYATNAVDVLNPAEQYRQSRVLRTDVITDQNVLVDQDMRVYARSLHTVLKKLKPIN